MGWEKRGKTFIARASDSTSVSIKSTFARGNGYFVYHERDRSSFVVIKEWRDLPVGSCSASARSRERERKVVRATINADLRSRGGDESRDEHLPPSHPLPVAGRIDNGSRVLESRVPAGKKPRSARGRFNASLGKLMHRRADIYIHIYIYICVCILCAEFCLYVDG